VQLPLEKGGLNGSAIIIDTENTFRPDRIKDMSEGVELDFKDVLKNIHVARSYNSNHQILLVEKAESLQRN
jgi:DNA repair protein RadA